MLWEMSLAQIMLYHNIGCDIKYPDPKKQNTSLADASYEDVKKVRDELRELYGAV